MEKVEIFLVTRDKDEHISTSYVFALGAINISYNYKKTVVMEGG